MDQNNMLVISELRDALLQSSKRNEMFASGDWIILTWSKEPSKNIDDHTYYIELFNSTGNTIIRKWRIKENNLVSDEAPISEDQYKKLETYWADWWQELFNQGKNMQENKTLKRAISSSLNTLQVNWKVYDIIKVCCKINLGGEGFDAILYKIDLELLDEDGESHTLGLLVDCPGNGSPYRLIQYGHNTNSMVEIVENGNQQEANIEKKETAKLNKHKNSAATAEEVQLKLDKEKIQAILLAARSQLAELEPFYKDSIIFYYLSKKCQKDSYNRLIYAFDVVIIDSKKKLIPIDLLIFEFEGKYSLGQAKRLNLKSEQSIISEGQYFDVWQSIFINGAHPRTIPYLNESLIATFTYLPDIRNIEKIVSVEGKANQDMKFRMFEGFHYKLRMTCLNSQQEMAEKEVIIWRHSCFEKYELISPCLKDPRKLFEHESQPPSPTFPKEESKQKLEEQPVIKPVQSKISEETIRTQVDPCGKENIEIEPNLEEDLQDSVNEINISTTNLLKQSLKDKGFIKIEE